MDRAPGPPAPHAPGGAGGSNGSGPSLPPESSLTFPAHADPEQPSGPATSSPSQSRASPEAPSFSDATAGTGLAAGPPGDLAPPGAEGTGSLGLPADHAGAAKRNDEAAPAPALADAAPAAPTDGIDGPADPEAAGDFGPPSSAHDGWRVKVYRLRDQDGSWEDLGTGRIRGKAHSRLEEGEEWAIAVEAEDETGAAGGERWVVRCPIQAPEDYTRQDGTIITWNEQPSNVDLALSFQEDLGCAAVWRDIQDEGAAAQAAGKLEHGFLPTDASFAAHGEDDAGEGEDAANRSYFETHGLSREQQQPPHRQGSVADMMRRTFGFGRSDSEDESEADVERLREQLRRMTPSALPRLADLIAGGVESGGDHVCHVLSRQRCAALDAFLSAALAAEAAGDVPSLHAAHRALSLVFSVATRDLVERCCAPHRFLAVAAICEFDPGLPARPRHRLHLLTRSTLVRAIEPDVPELTRRAHLLFRLGFLKDVLAPRMGEDRFVSMLERLVAICRSEIVSAVADMGHISSSMVELVTRWGEPPQDDPTTPGRAGPSRSPGSDAGLADASTPATVVPDSDSAKTPHGRPTASPPGPGALMAGPEAELASSSSSSSSSVAAVAEAAAAPSAPRPVARRASAVGFRGSQFEPAILAFMDGPAGLYGRPPSLPSCEAAGDAGGGLVAPAGTVEVGVAHRAAVSVLAAGPSAEEDEDSSGDEEGSYSASSHHAFGMGGMAHSGENDAARRRRWRSAPPRAPAPAAGNEPGAAEDDAVGWAVPGTRDDDVRWWWAERADLEGAGLSESGDAVARRGRAGSDAASASSTVAGADDTAAAEAIVPDDWASLDRPPAAAAAGPGQGEGTQKRPREADADDAAAAPLGDEDVTSSAASTTTVPPRSKRAKREDDGRRAAAAEATAAAAASPSPPAPAPPGGPPLPGLQLTRVTWPREQVRPTPATALRLILEILASASSTVQAVRAAVSDTLSRPSRRGKPLLAALATVIADPSAAPADLVVALETVFRLAEADPRGVCAFCAQDSQANPPPDANKWRRSRAPEPAATATASDAEPPASASTPKDGDDDDEGKEDEEDAAGAGWQPRGVDGAAPAPPRPAPIPPASWCGLALPPRSAATRRAIEACSASSSSPSSSSAPPPAAPHVRIQDVAADRLDRIRRGEHGALVACPPGSSLLQALVWRVVDDPDVCIQLGASRVLQALVLPDPNRQLDKDSILEAFDRHLPWLCQPFINPDVGLARASPVAAAAARAAGDASSQSPTTAAAASALAAAVLPRRAAPGGESPPSKDSKCHVIGVLEAYLDADEERVIYFAIRYRLVLRVVQLLHYPDQHCQLAAVRLLQACIDATHDSIASRMAEMDLFGPVAAALHALRPAPGRPLRPTLVFNAIAALAQALANRRDARGLILGIVDRYGAIFERFRDMPAFSALFDAHAAIRQRQQETSAARNRGFGSLRIGGRALSSSGALVGAGGSDSDDALADADDDDDDDELSPPTGGQARGRAPAPGPAPGSAAGRVLSAAELVSAAMSAEMDRWSDEAGREEEEEEEADAGAGPAGDGPAPGPVLRDDASLGRTAVPARQDSGGSNSSDEDRRPPPLVGLARIGSGPRAAPAGTGLTAVLGPTSPPETPALQREALEAAAAEAASERQAGDATLASTLPRPRSEGGFIERRDFEQAGSEDGAPAEPGATSFTGGRLTQRRASAMRVRMGKRGPP